MLAELRVGLYIFKQTQTLLSPRIEPRFLEPSGRKLVTIPIVTSFLIIIMMVVMMIMMMIIIIITPNSYKTVYIT